MSLRFAANLSMLYPELPFLDRFAAARADGFEGVEFLYPYAFDAQEIADRLQANGLQQVLFNAPPGGETPADMASAWERGLRGSLAQPDQQAAFEASIHLALQYATALQCQRIHVMSGMVADEADRDAITQLIVQRLQWAAPLAAQQGVVLLIEPINGRDMPGYFLQRQQDAHAIVQAVGAPNVKVQMDLYHCQIVEGDVSAKLRHYLPTGRVGHLQIASVPDRHEPGGGELHYPWVFDELKRLNWDGWIGCEYRPAGGAQPGATSQGLAWRPMP
jgi:hydroxypyruvate isomerase